MLFNSIQFAVFFPVVFILYWAVANKKVRTQNWLLLIASYYFYASWDYRFLFLLIFSTLLDYFTGIKMNKAGGRLEKRVWFWLSIVVNVGFLGIFKYYDFFATSFGEALSYLGLRADVWTIKVILPVGISFYTFHGLSYVIDIYNNKIKPERNFVTYALFVSFFPLLVAGPIERATHLLPQLKHHREFDYRRAVDGMRQILWGLFKKVVIADTCAQYVDSIFGNYAQYSGSTLLLGILFFAFQIYCDFSGYSDIALGTARLLGIELRQNFAFPYFSRDIAEFWRRWHISLSSWFRDYLYIPLGGSRGGTWMKIRNTFIIFLVSGFWHGANWTFIIWGALNALYFMPLLLLNKNRVNLEIVAKGRSFPSFRDLAGMSITFSLVTFAWIFFRSETVSQAGNYIRKLFSISFFDKPDTKAFASASVGPLIIILLILFFLLVEWTGRQQKHAFANFGLKWTKPLRWSVYYVLVMAIFMFMGKEQPFIYFQF
jgi:D-alanyl-lipoteichoic acid acyltransferase DltB (MBOAT superfamily)